MFKNSPPPLAHSEPMSCKIYLMGAPDISTLPPRTPSSPIWASAEFYQITGLMFMTSPPPLAHSDPMLCKIYLMGVPDISTLPPMTPSSPIWACAEFYQIPGLCLWLPHPLWPTLIQCRARFIWWVRLIFQLYPIWPPQAKYEPVRKFTRSLVYLCDFPTPSGPLWSNVLQDLSDGCAWHFNSTPHDPLKSNISLCGILLFIQFIDLLG